MHSLIFILKPERIDDKYTWLRFHFAPDSVFVTKASIDHELAAFPQLNVRR